MNASTNANVVAKSKIRSAATVIAVLTAITGPMPALAHEPIFMISHEAPGKGAFDVHTAFQHERRGAERGLEVEQEFTYGVTRDLAVRLSIPYVRQEMTTNQGQVDESGLGDPRVRLKWRFWDKDLPGVKYAVAGVLESTIPLGTGDARLGRDQPSLLAGLAHGREGLSWYYFVDARYLYHVPDDDTKPSDRIYLDAAYGLRPELRGLEDTDIVYFFELNYLHERKAEANGVVDPDSGGDFLFFSPEVLISPTNRVMFRGGVQIPILQSFNGQQEPKDFALKALAEFRF
ncbi:MAG: transporter [Nitrospirota bacterium]